MKTVFDLRSCELVLFICACIAGCVIWVFRRIYDERIPSAMKFGVYVILFLAGQGAVYLLCKRLVL